MDKKTIMTMKKTFDDPKDNVAFERCIDVLAKLNNSCARCQKAG